MLFWADYYNVCQGAVMCCLPCAWRRHSQYWQLLGCSVAGSRVSSSGHGPHPPSGHLVRAHRWLGPKTPASLVPREIQTTHSGLYGHRLQGAESLIAKHRGTACRQVSALRGRHPRIPSQRSRWFESISDYGSRSSAQASGARIFGTWTGSQVRASTRIIRKAHQSRPFER